MIFNYENIKRGYEWLKKHYPRITENVTRPDELYHHGIKGQKWGVRNGPPYPIDRSSKRDTIVKDAIESGTGF
ncbi:MAG: hypothetical protein HFG80_05935 [Eubacterium sp.]|nr:hypothetical protein [Eubacterium sp.]